MNLYEALMSDEALHALPSEWEKHLSRELFWLTREIMDSHTGYHDIEDKKRSCEALIARTFACYRDWLGYTVKEIPTVIDAESIPHSPHLQAS